MRAAARHPRGRRRAPRGPRWPAWALGAAAGVVADRWLGEPPVPGRLHPVALFGSATGWLERRLYADDSRRGALHAAIGAGLALGAGCVVELAATRAPGRLAGALAPTPAAPPAGATVATYVACAGRALHDAAREVGAALEAGDLGEARRRLPALVGRDPGGLDAGGLTRAVVESVAENTTDAVVAPALWAAVAGPPGALLHRAADTLDSMVGYRDARYRRFGTPAARLDDALAWGPARVTAGLVALVRPRRAAEVWRVVRRDGTAHPSPNAGIAEAAFAAALGVQLGGTNRYAGVDQHRPLMGDGRPPVPTDIDRAIALSRHVTWALAGCLGMAGAAAWRRRSRSGRRTR